MELQSCPHCGANHPNGMTFCTPAALPLAPGVRHAYPLAIREAGLGTAMGLFMKTMPYALARFGILFAASVITLIWCVIAFGGWAFFGARVHPFLGFAWFMLCCVVYGYVWWTIVRYFLYL